MRRVDGAQYKRAMQWPDAPYAARCIEGRGDHAKLTYLSRRLDGYKHYAFRAAVWPNSLYERRAFWDHIRNSIEGR